MAGKGPRRGARKFRYFKKLPPELRRMIWQEALNEDFAVPQVCRPQWKTGGDKMRTSTTSVVDMHLPAILFACVESRELALANNLNFRTCTGDGYYCVDHYRRRMAYRSFRPDIDLFELSIFDIFELSSTAKHAPSLQILSQVQHLVINGLIINGPRPRRKLAKNCLRQMSSLKTINTTKLKGWLMYAKSCSPLQVSYKRSKLSQQEQQEIMSLFPSRVPWRNPDGKRRPVSLLKCTLVPLERSWP